MQVKLIILPVKNLFTLMGLVLFVQDVHAVGLTVSNVRSSQRPGTQLVDIDYDLADADSPTLTVSIAVSTNGGASYTLPATSFSGAVGVSVTPGVNKRITWNAGADWPNKFSANVRFRVTASDDTAPSGMALIPAGSFTMGDTFSEGDSDELPLHDVYVSAFYMDKYEVTKALWDEVYNWATAHGYSFTYAGIGKAANHPVNTIFWHDAVKWCNARSEREGLTPCYYTDASYTTIYRTGRLGPTNACVKWNTNGYRLPTEAEWEKAARGGASGKRFPWSDVNTIDHSRANYCAGEGGYDVNPTGGYHPTFNDGVYPYTSPVGYFLANGYGLYDMAGNLSEWCWNWYDSTYYGQPAATADNPRGPPTALTARVLRDGPWENGANFTRCAGRAYVTNSDTDSYTSGGIGFRCVRGL